MWATDTSSSKERRPIRLARSRARPGISLVQRAPLRRPPLDVVTALSLVQPDDCTLELTDRASLTNTTSSTGDCRARLAMRWARRLTLHRLTAYNADETRDDGAPGRADRYFHAHHRQIQPLHQGRPAVADQLAQTDEVKTPDQLNCNVRDHCVIHGDLRWTERRRLRWTGWIGRPRVHFVDWTVAAAIARCWHGVRRMLSTRLLSTRSAVSPLLPFAAAGTVSIVDDAASDARVLAANSAVAGHRHGAFRRRSGRWRRDEGTPGSARSV